VKISHAVRLALLPVAVCASASALATASPNTPITNVIVLYQENVSFDHYFGTYPNAQNNAGETPFQAYPGTPTVNGLANNLLATSSNGQTYSQYTFTQSQTQQSTLLQSNPNRAAGSGTDAGQQINPGRLSPSQAYTCSQNHNYGPEQQAVDGGLMDKFPLYTGRTTSEGCAPDGSTVLGYYDGNTVTAYWNYAQNYSMNDNNFGSTFGPSTPGAINLISGQTYGGITHYGTGSTASWPNTVSQSPSSPSLTATGAVVTDIGDFDPYLDDCGNDAGGTVHTTTTLEMNSDPTAATGNRNIGDLLNAAGVTWGWFGGGFLATTQATFNKDGTLATPAVCGKGRTLHIYPSNAVYVAPNSSSTPGAVVVPNPVSPFVTGADIHNPSYGPDGDPTPYTTPSTGFYISGTGGNGVAGENGNDYVPHHEPFQFYASTRNPHHLPPSSTAAIGTAADQANHQYDTSNFFQALNGGSLPAVSFVKAPYAYNGHPGNSDPISEQYWITQVVNAVMQSSYWPSGGVAIIIAYDDSDGWYDHVTGPIVNPSAVSGAATAYPSALTADGYTAPGSSVVDNFAGVGNCGTPNSGTNAAYPARCGYGPRLPLIVISPYSGFNYVDHTLTNQASIINFIEYNWNLGNIDRTTPANGQASFDRLSGSLFGLFNFNNPPNTTPFLLTCSGAVAASAAQACPVDPNP
jgi:phospholipase C